MPDLSKRLKTIADLVPRGVNVCDVGTDHAYLPAALYLSRKFGKITATDIREKPLQNARNNIEKLGADGVNLVLCDGLDGVKESDAEAVIIAGMGGDVISGIIERCPFKQKPLYILQPMTAASVLREYLAKGGFAVIKEIAVTENKKIYSVMLCRFDGKTKELSPAKKRIGELKPETPENISYIKKQLDICKKCINDLKKAGIASPALAENIKAAEQLSDILGKI